MYDDLDRSAEEIEGRSRHELEKWIGDYRATFLTDCGGRVLRDILRDHFVLEIAKIPEHVVLQQAGIVLLRKLGVLEAGREVMAIDALLRQNRL